VNNLFIHSSRKEFVGSIHDANAGVTRRIGTTASGTETGETIGRFEIISLGTMANGVCVSQVTAVCFLEVSFFVCPFTNGVEEELKPRSEQA
jgi:hypothetical protein